MNVEIRRLGTFSFPAYWAKCIRNVCLYLLPKCDVWSRSYEKKPGWPQLWMQRKNLALNGSYLPTVSSPRSHISFEQVTLYLRGGIWFRVSISWRTILTCMNFFIECHMRTKKVSLKYSSVYLRNRLIDSGKCKIDISNPHLTVLVINIWRSA